jgi:L,D-transpeptidase catalytic domain
MVCVDVRAWRSFKLSVAAFAGAGAVLLIGTGATDASAKSRRESKREEATYTRPTGTPILAVVSINQQRITVYDAHGRMLQSPISSGKPGYETPPGVFTVLEKKVEHRSNVYLDALMPYMQRITWSGIALHAGILPGHAASGGCIRLPMGFAEHLFGRTKLGMRVIVVRDDVSPAEIVHPALFQPQGVETPPVTAMLAPGKGSEGAAKTSTGIVDAVVTDARPEKRPSLKVIVAAKAAEAEVASKKVEEMRRVVVKAKADVVRFPAELRRAQAAVATAEARLRQAERGVEAADDDAEAAERAKGAKAAAESALGDARAQLAAVEAQVQQARELMTRAVEEARAALAAKSAALQEVKDTQAKMTPVSIMISRSTQRIYVRQNREPLFDTAVIIADPDTQLGTYVFTAVGYAKADTELRWDVVSMYRSAKGPEADTKGAHAVRNAEAFTADLAGAKRALERVTIPKEALERISEVVAPGSSLIISDEPVSRETAKGTDFIVVMSNELQGGLKIRRPRYMNGGSYRQPSYRAPEGWNPFLWW